MALRYGLIVLSHGEAPCLEETITSFIEMVTPTPKEKVLTLDGSGWIPGIDWDGWMIDQKNPQQGFCKATQRCWQTARHLDVDYIFHLEHDFRFIRPLDLGPLARVLDSNRYLAQMSLMRNAVNEEEKAAGGVFQWHLGRWEPRWAAADGSPTGLGPPLHWLEHDICLTTNPSLMRKEFMVDNPWPDYPSQCEGLFSGDLRARGYTFGTWGTGEIWVEHSGKLRTGHSY